jgi:uncharacterized membrane protein HdeD (DUF308 family)
MLEAVTRNWWALVVRGVLGILFGIAAIAWPVAALAALVIVFGAYVLVDGVLALAEAVMHWREAHRWPLVAEGVLGIIFGLAVLIMPLIAAIAGVYLIAAWALVTGVLEIVNGVRLRDQIQGEFWMILSGVLSVIFGLLIAFSPVQGAIAITWIIGIYALLFGIFLVVLGFRMRGVHERIQTGGSQRYSGA